jgi:hypothetical protein
LARTAAPTRREPRARRPGRRRQATSGASVAFHEGVEDFLLRGPLRDRSPPTSRSRAGVLKGDHRVFERPNSSLQAVDVVGGPGHGLMIGTTGPGSAAVRAPATSPRPLLHPGEHDDLPRRSRPGRTEGYEQVLSHAPRQAPPKGAERPGRRFLSHVPRQRRDHDSARSHPGSGPPRGLGLGPPSFACSYIGRRTPSLG